MATVEQVARAFVQGKAMKAGNAATDGKVYTLFGNVIARHGDAQRRGIQGDWCGWYSVSTARHLNEIADAIGNGRRYSYAAARQQAVNTFDF
jgi:hypothetical protein